MPTKKPTRYDVKVDSWQERDRLGIWVTDTRTNKTIAEWWDDAAREMFEDGFFKPGVPQHSWEKPTPAFVDSVLDYLEDTGVLAKESALLGKHGVEEVVGEAKRRERVVGTTQELYWLTIDELKVMCRKVGLPDTGSKKELVQRLKAKYW